MKIYLAQQNYHIGNFESNTAKIISAIKSAKAEGADLVVFSEMCICGYPARDFVDFRDFIDKCYQCVDAIKEHADAIVKSADVDAERLHFSELSSHTYELVKAFGAGKKIYYDHCPMAFNGKGANWLSEASAIQNPYMGTKMPECGSVEQIIE